MCWERYLEYEHDTPVTTRNPKTLPLRSAPQPPEEPRHPAFPPTVDTALESINDPLTLARV